MSTTIGGVRIVDMPDLGTVTNTSSIVGEHLGSGRFSAPALRAYTSSVINVLDYGADPTGVADSAPAFRACMGSDRVIFVPRGTYLFNSLLPVPSPYIAIMPPCVLGEGLNNFTITGYGATIKLGTGGNRSTVFLFDRCSNFEVMGLTIEGNRTGLGTTRTAEARSPRSIAADPNVGITTMSGVNFAFSDLHMTGIFVYCLQGDWWVNGVFRNITIDAADIAFDTAYLYRVLIDHADMTGSDMTATNNQAHPGAGGFSCIVDPNNAPYNFTGYAFSNTQHVTIRNCRASNFNTGCYTTTGTYWTLVGNRWHDNPGIGPNVGVGVFLGYDHVSGAGAPVSNVVICGDTLANNGAVGNGAGLLFEPPSGSDFTQDVTIVGCLFDNNKVDGIAPHASNTNIRRLQSIGNTFTGALQANDINPVLVPSFTAVVGGAHTQQTISGPLVIGNAAGGINFSPSLASSNSDLTHHIQLAGPQYGFGVTGNRINYNVPTGSQHIFLVNGVDTVAFPSTGIFTTGGIGLFGHGIPVGMPTVSGTRGGNVALASLLTALVAYGLISDGTVP